MKLADIERVRLVEGLDRDASRTYRLWESAGHVLKEFQLDPKQIEQLFAQVEKDATAAGGNRTAIGQGIDTATAAGKAIKTAYDDLVDKVQNSAPMQNADAEYDKLTAQLKAATGGDAGVMQYVQKYRDFATKHPVAQSFIYAALIAAAGISGAGLGGAAVLGLLKMTDRLLQGDKFSSALGKGAMTGATALAAGQIGQAVQGTDAALPSTPVAPDTSAVDAVADTAVDAGKEGAKSAASTAATTRAAGAAADVTDTAVNVAQEVVKGSGVEMFPGLATDQMANDSIRRIADKIASGSLTQAEMDHLQATQSWIRAQITDAGFNNAPKEFWSYHNLLDKMTRAADSVTVKESYTRYIDPVLTIRQWALKESQGRPRGGVRLTEAGVRRVFDIIETKSLNEGIMDTIKGAAKNVVGKVVQTGKNITTKITADKLMKAWVADGSNPDSEAVKGLLVQQGVAQPTIDSAMKAVGIAATPPAAPAAPEATTTAPAATKTLATKPAAPAAPATTTPAPAPAAPANYGGAQKQVTPTMKMPTAPVAKATPTANYGGKHQKVTPTIDVKHKSLA